MWVGGGDGVQRGTERVAMERVASWFLWEFSFISGPFRTAKAFSPRMASDIPPDEKHVILSGGLGCRLEESWTFPFHHRFKKWGGGEGGGNNTKKSTVSALLENDECCFQANPSLVT